VVRIFLIQLAIKWLFNFPRHPMSVSALRGKRKRTKYCILTTLVLLLNQKNTQNTHFVHNFIILANSLSNCSFFNCVQKCLKCWPTNMGSARRHFLHSLIAALITFCSRPIQTTPVTSWIHQYSWMLCLFHRHAAAQQSNLAIDWLLVATYPERWNFIKCCCWF